VVSALQRFNDLTTQRGKANFLRNSQPNLAQYISERPEMISHGEKSKKPKQQTKGN
jgi:hypothetical protein